MARTQRRIRAAQPRAKQADRLTVLNGETEEQERERFKLLDGALRGDVDKIIEYLTKYGGEEWQE